MVYKPIYIWGAPSCTYPIPNPVFSIGRIQLLLLRFFEKELSIRDDGAAKIPAVATKTNSTVPCITHTNHIGISIVYIKLREIAQKNIKLYIISIRWCFVQAYIML